MKKVFILLTISFLFINCNKKELKIPVLAKTGVQEVLDHSQVWMFFEVKNNDTLVKINRKNTISSTNWIYNIDKRLPLKLFIEDLKSLKYKHANSIHSKEGKYDYFSYSDTISKKLSFLEFDKVEFKTDSLLSKQYIKTNSDKYQKYFNVNLTFNPNNIWINDGKFEKEGIETLLLEYIDFSAEESKTMLHTNFNNRLNYQEYLHFKTLLNSLKNEAIKINNIEFIFDQTKVPDCGCE